MDADGYAATMVGRVAPRRACGVLVDRALDGAGWPGLAPVGELLSFASPKESNQRKGDPTVCDPGAALRGNLRCSRNGGRPQTRCAQTCVLLVPVPLRCSAQPEGAGGQKPEGKTTYSQRQNPTFTWICIDPSVNLSLGIFDFAPAERSDGSPNPSGCAEERRAGRMKGWRCLSEASLASPRPVRAPQVARSVAKGRKQQGRLLFAYFLLAKQEKVRRLPGRHPASVLGKASPNPTKSPIQKAPC